MNFKANLLKKLIIFLVLILVAGTAFAANGDTLNIGGTVPLVLSLTVTAESGIDNLALNTADANDHTENLASIVIASNASAGWDLYIYSANDGVMTNADGDTIAYTLLYASPDSTTLGTDVAPSTAGVSYAEETNTTGDASGDLDMIYNQSTAYAAGYYSDQLTLVLRAK